MSRMASGTGLVAARIRPVHRPKPKKLELLGSSTPAPFVLRPFAGLFNPYPYGCSVLCNHPADGEAKEVVRRAKDTWASEGRSLLLASEARPSKISGPDALDTAQVPEELFRRYTDTDSRPPSAAKSSIPSYQQQHQQVQPHRDEKSRPSLILDLRTSSQDVQECETLSWHTLTLEPLPSSRRSGLSGSSMRNRPKLQVSPRHRSPTTAASSSVRSIPVLEVSDAVSTRSAPTNLGPGLEELGLEEEEEENSSITNQVPVRRRGKLRRKKRKSRRESIYGQLTEVRGPPEPLETQVSQIEENSRRQSIGSQLEETKAISSNEIALPANKHEMLPSFLPPQVLKELSRELTQEMVEWEFNSKRRVALEEVLRVMGDFHPAIRGSRQNQLQQPHAQDIPRLFYRQSARFELLDSQSLIGLKPLDYLGRYVYMSDTRKLMFGRAFNMYREETTSGLRYLLGKNAFEALHNVMGRALADHEITFLEKSLGKMYEKLDFRTWCGVCAFAERSIPELLPREEDPPSWLERTDFEMLDRRLSRVQVDEGLASMLRFIRDH